MSFILQDNLVRIDAEVNGQAQSAVLDSGTGALMVDRTLVHRLNLVERKTSVRASGGGTSTQQIKTAELDNVQVGPLQFRDTSGYTADLSSLSSSARFPIDVLVGAPAFKYGAVTINYPQRRITFGPTGSAVKCARPIPLALIHDVPVVEVELQISQASAPIRLKLMVDLGTRHAAAMLGGRFLRSEAGQELSRSGVAQQVGTGIGGKVQGTIAHIAKLQIAQETFEDLDVALTSKMAAAEAGIIDGTLGVPLWRTGIVTFDYPAHQMCIELPGSIHG